MKSILRGRRLITLMLLLFLTGMIVLVVRIQLEGILLHFPVRQALLRYGV